MNSLTQHQQRVERDDLQSEFNRHMKELEDLKEELLAAQDLEAPSGDQRMIAMAIAKTRETLHRLAPQLSRDFDRLL
ncbi:MAG: hypothetical protein AAF438_05590 [Pseudomonadota bacterium]